MTLQNLLLQLGRFQSISQLENKNQFEIIFEKGRVFQSYKTIIAIEHGSNVYITDNWNYSKTTLKHLKIFLGTTMSKKEIENKIKQGDFILLSK